MNTLRSISFINLGYKVHTNNKQTYHSPFGTSLSILQLVENRIMDIKIASLLWFLAKQKASFIVAAPPRLAGKTTVLNSILQLIPIWFKILVIDATKSNLTEIKLTEHTDTYMLVLV